jgi:hypothetical protein
MIIAVSKKYLGIRLILSIKLKVWGKYYFSTSISIVDHNNNLQYCDFCVCVF